MNIVKEQLELVRDISDIIDTTHQTFGRDANEIIDSLKSIRSGVKQSVNYYVEQYRTFNEGDLACGILFDENQQPVLKFGKILRDHRLNQCYFFVDDGTDLSGFSILDDTCIPLNNERIYQFKVRDYTTMLVGRFDTENRTFYIQRGDGIKFVEYECNRVTYCKQLIEDANT